MKNIAKGVLLTACALSTPPCPFHCTGLHPVLPCINSKHEGSGTHHGIKDTFLTASCVKGVNWHCEEECHEQH